jgi:hypothetical protein
VGCLQGAQLRGYRVVRVGMLQLDRRSVVGAVRGKTPAAASAEGWSIVL